MDLLCVRRVAHRPPSLASPGRLTPGIDMAQDRLLVYGAKRPGTAVQASMQGVYVVSLMSVAFVCGGVGVVWTAFPGLYARARVVLSVEFAS